MSDGQITGDKGECLIEPHTIGDTDADHVQMSIAISLKRIADALSGEGENILTRPLNNYGEGIGECIQGQIERGNR